MKKISILLIITMALMGCAGAQYRPIVDIKSVDMNAYENDLKECQAYAGQTAGSAKTAAAGAIIGALLGALIVGIAGGNNRQRSQGAGIGAVSGAVHGGVAGEVGQRDIIKRCLAGRGYKVLQ